MPPSQLKQLKAALHQQRLSKDKSSKKPQPLSRQKPKQTAQERSYAARTKTLLPELQSRNKVGGITDRRFGEDDPTLDPEERALRRFAQSQRSKKRNVFNLEDASDDEEALTHFGKPLDVQDDFQREFEIADEDDEGLDKREQRKRKFEEVLERAAQVDDEEPRKKSKKEVMEEVIAKSKLHKYERQQQKEDDDTVREQLDKGLPDLLAALRGSQPNSKDLQVQEEKQAREREYDLRVRQMIQDKRAAPTERTKTAEEKAEEDAQRLKEMEEKRQRRMQGEEDSSDEDVDDSKSGLEGDEDVPDEEDEDSDNGEAAGFGLDAPQTRKVPLDVEDEDDFIIDEDLVASGSDIDEDDISSLDEDEEDEAVEDDDDEFLRDILPASSKDATNSTKSAGQQPAQTDKTLAFTYPCPQTLDHFLTVIKDVTPADIPVVIQRIRALYHPQLANENKQKLAQFSSVLVEFISHACSSSPPTPLSATEQVIRHVHSLTRSHGDSVANAFRRQLSQMQSSNEPPTPGDLSILTAISTIYPTSDHFHQVVTPAMTVMGRWLGIVLIPCTSAAASLRGAYLVSLCLRYQRLAKRFVPEAMRFTHAALSSPETLNDPTLVDLHVNNIRSMSTLWRSHVAFTEIFTPTLAVLSTLNPSGTPRKTSSEVTTRIKQLHNHLTIALAQATQQKRPLELHHHRPLPIKSSIPKFEGEGFNPAKHYDPDAERAEQAKLRKEYKREKKGAMRELRKDADFLAREQLSRRKEADRAYEDKQRRIIGEIQREEGREKNEYEREKRRRKGRR